MKLLRKVLFWAHLSTALVVGIVVLIMSATGVLLTYQRQMTWWVDTRGMEAGAPSPGSQRLDTDALLARVTAQVEGEPTGVTWYSDPDAPVAVAFGRGRTIYANGYTGEVLGEGSERIRAFFRVTTDWHRWLARAGESRDAGRAITGASNLAFLFIILSGLYLWWPRNWHPKALRNVLFFRRGLSPKARDFNWHNVIGFWSSIPLAIVVASATVISYPWATDLAYRLVGDTPPSAAQGGGQGGSGGGQAAGGPPGPLASADVAPENGGATAGAGRLEIALLEAIAEQQVDGWRSITRQISAPEQETIAFTIDTGDGGQPQKRAQLVLSAATGEVVGWEPFSAGSPGRRFRSILRFAHTGEVLGIPGQTIAGLVSLGAVFLVWTGIALTLRRFAAWLRRRASPPRSGSIRRQPGGEMAA